jgi:translation initiation factor 2 subunit 2
MDYEKLLERAQSKIPKKTTSGERFEIPRVKGHVEGSKTIITNFLQITSILHREPAHLIKFLLKELAAPGSLNGQRLIMGRKLSSKLINEKIAKYANEFVICKTCGKPDTHFVKEGRILTLKCAACGAKYPINSRI